MVSRRRGLRLYAAFLTAVALERLVELAVSRRHERWAATRGGREVAPEQMRAIAALHAALLPAALLEAAVRRRPPRPALSIGAAGLFVAAEALRWWTITTLGPRWSVRVVVIPGAPTITGGPYRFVRHPNYLAVVAEVAAIPLVGGATTTAAVASALHAVVLSRRIATEERALAEAGDYGAALGGRPRLVPHLARWRGP